MTFSVVVHAITRKPFMWLALVQKIWPFATTKLPVANHASWCSFVLWFFPAANNCHGALNYSECVSKYQTCTLLEVALRCQISIEDHYEKDAGNKSQPQREAWGHLRSTHLTDHPPKPELWNMSRTLAVFFTLCKTDKSPKFRARIGNNEKLCPSLHVVYAVYAVCVLCSDLDCGTVSSFSLQISEAEGWDSPHSLRPHWFGEKRKRRFHSLVPTLRKVPTCLETGDNPQSTDWSIE